MIRLFHISRYCILLILLQFVLSEYSTAQSFLTQDYPEYAYKTKIRYQHAFFNHLDQEEASIGVYNISADIPFNHILSGIINIPVMADYTVSDDKNVRVGNIELGLKIINPKWDYQSSVFKLSFIIPFSTHNIYNRENIYGELNTLTELSCITDYAKCHWYLPGLWTASASYTYHFKRRSFQLLVGFEMGFMAGKYTDRHSTKPITHISDPILFIQPTFSVGYTIKNILFTGEILNTIYASPWDSDLLNIENGPYFTSAAGVTYKLKFFQPGIFYQTNISKEISKYATHILGLQLIFHLDKKEKYLKSLPE